MIGLHRKSNASFSQDVRGLAAIEFAMIAPVLVAVVLLVTDVARFEALNGTMQRSVRAGEQYVMNGGTDAAATTAVVNQAWIGKPAGSTVSVATVCVCGGTTVTCGTLCGDGTAAQKNTTIAVTTHFSGFLLSLPETASEVVRVG